MLIRCLNIKLSSNWNLVFAVIELLKKIAVTSEIKYIHVPQRHIVISTKPEVPNVPIKKFPL